MYVLLSLVIHVWVFCLSRSLFRTVLICLVLSFVRYIFI